MLLALSGMEVFVQLLLAVYVVLLTIIVVQEPVLTIVVTRLTGHGLATEQMAEAVLAVRKLNP